MNNIDQKTNSFLSGPILPPLLQFALPLMLSQLLQAFYGGVDLMVVGGIRPPPAFPPWPPAARSCRPSPCSSPA